MKGYGRRPAPSAPPAYTAGAIYSEPIPPPPNLPLPPLPTSAYPLALSPSMISSASTASTWMPSSESSFSIIGERAANFEVPKYKIAKRQDKPSKAFNPHVLTRRYCTNTFFLFLFIAFLVGWGVVAAFAFSWGKPERLLHPTDSRGRMCGHVRPGAYDMTSRPFLLFFDLTKCVSYSSVLSGCPTRQVCVEECPSEYFSYLQLQTASQNTFKEQVESKLVCDEHVNKSSINSFADLRALVASGDCTAYTVKSAAVVGRCMPAVFIDANSTIASVQNASLDSITGAVGQAVAGNAIPFAVPTDAQLQNSTTVLNGVVNSKEILQKVAADLSVCWNRILVFFGITAAVAFIWIVVMRILGGLIIWASIFVLIALLMAGAIFSWHRYDQLVQAGAINDYSFQPVFSVYFEMPRTWLVIAIVCAALFLIVTLVFLLVRSRIRLAVAVIGETSSALGHMLSTLFFPLLPIALHVCIFLAWGTIAIWLASSGDDNCRQSSSETPTLAELEIGGECDCDSLGTLQGVNCHFVNVTKDTDAVFYMQMYNLFGCFWLSCFIGALSDITLAGAFASYYWAFRKPKDVPALPVIRSLGRAFRYHMGSLAVGSLFLSIVKIIRVILDYLYHKMHASENTVVKTIFNVIKCCFCCLESILRFMSQNAYIMIAIYGKGFFAAARDSFSLLARNVVRTVVLGRVVTFLLFVGKATITIGMGILAYYYFSGEWVINGLVQIELYYFFVPVAIVVVGAYCICDLFFEVFEMGVRTIFLCFLEDGEANDGSAAKPYYMSEKLRSLYGKENKF